MKKILKNIPFLLAIALVLAACSNDSGGSGSSNKALTLKLAHTGSDNHQYHIGAEEFAKLIEEKSDGNMKVDIHGNSTLGDEAEAVEQVMDGTIEMTVVAADSSLANTVPGMNIFGIPYLFEDRDHVYSELDGETGEQLLELINDKNMKGLGFWEVGFRHMTNNKKEVNVPEDLKGMKVRVQPAPVWEAHMKALGANATPVSFTELYSALDQGLVDGQENPLSSIYSMKFYEVQKYISLTSHTYSPAIVIMSNKAWNNLDEDQQKIVEEAIVESTEYQRDFLVKQDDEIIEELEEAGVIFTEPDREKFKDATKDVKDTLKDQVPSELIEAIQR